MIVKRLVQGKMEEIHELPAGPNTDDWINLLRQVKNMQNFTPRPSQKKILAYKGGPLGIAAVPGAGKTFTLSALAAQIITSGKLAPNQEVLIVTLVNSAVDNFAHRIGSFIHQKGLIPHLGYRVRTLHGLAHDIVREKPGRVGLEERFQIVDEREAEAIRREAVRAWLAMHPDFMDYYLKADLEDYQRRRLEQKDLPEMVESLALAFIRSTKDRRLTPEQIRAKLDSAPGPLLLAEMGCAIYADYQRALSYRGAVDFDDLIRLSLELLENDDEFLERLRYRYPFVLEDEAQDSSELQEKILGLIAQTNPSNSAGRGWVRVGDPNQAIFETFTTASPELLRRFIRENPHVDMPESGRSQPAIIELANRLITWTMKEHPHAEIRSALEPPYITPAPRGDPQPNPENDPAGIVYVRTKFTPEQEIEAVANSIEKWLPEHADATVAVLVPRNTRGTEVIDALRKRGIEPVEFLSSTSGTRATAGALSILLSFLSDPQSSSRLAKVYQVWRREVFGGGKKAIESDGDSGAAEKHPYEQVHGLLKKLGAVEDFLAPTEDRDWLASVGAALTPKGRGEQKGQENAGEAEPVSFIQNELMSFREDVRRWLAAVTLPIDQLVLTLAQDVFFEPAELALAHKLALVLRQAADTHPDWRLPELTAELIVIAKNERRFIGFSSDDSGFDPQRHRGKVVVTTMHKAKGLEWDRVYLMSLNNYDFPSLESYDTYISEKWFVKASAGSSGPLNLEAEALGQLKALLSDGEFDWYEEGAETQRARVDYVRERLRLLYVGITRAKRELIMTWNNGRRGDSQPCIPIQALL
jgi:DNA helicase-2/ATP-dependent DNA helicase PcrA